MQLKDVNATGAARVAGEREFAKSRFEYLVARRDQLADRARFGLLSLNGATLVGLFAVTDSTVKLDSLGLSVGDLKAGSLFFITGAVFAAFSTWFEANRMVGEPADAFVRWTHFQSRNAMLELPDTQDARDRDTELADKESALPLVDFQFSRLAIGALNFSGASWLGGLAMLTYYAFW